jgi:hypothetical protein
LLVSRGIDFALFRVYALGTGRAPISWFLRGSASPLEAEKPVCKCTYKLALMFDNIGLLG